MDPFSVLGVTASIIACIQLTGSILKKLGPSDHNKQERNRILKVVSGFRGAYEGLKLCLEFNEQDSARLSMLKHLEAALRDSKDCLDFLEERLKTVGFIGQHIIGTAWDRSLKQRMRRLEDAKEFFELALHADQQIILGAVESYVRNSAKQIQAVHIVLNSNGKRLLELDEKASRQHEQVEKFHRMMTDDIGKIDQNLEAHDRNAEQRDEQISERLQIVRDGVESWTTQASERASERMRKDTLNWLANTDSSIDHNVACAKRQEHTGCWFLHGQDYLNWKEAPCSFLWLNGIPGCGKTIFSTIIKDMVSFISSKPTSAIAYFYFSFNDTDKQRTINFLRSAIVQLAIRKSGCSADLQILYNTYSPGEPPLDALKSLLQSILNLPGDNYIIVDALDECPSQNGERHRLCASLREISTWALPNLHILITSRQISDINNSISLIGNAVTVLMQNKLVDQDIQTYIKVQLEENERLNRWPTQVKQEIMTTLKKKANGMYDYPLYLFEESDSVEQSKRSSHRSNCPCSKSIKLIRLAHFSVKEYMVSNRIADDIASIFQIVEEPSVCFIAKSCLTYISHIADLESSFCGSIWNWEQPRVYNDECREEWESRAYDLCVQFPLLDHAFKYWTSYVRLCKNKTVIDLTCKCLASDSWLSIWPRFFKLRGAILWKRQRIVQELASPLYHAAVQGLSYVCRELLEAGADPNQCIGFFGSPLIAAVANSHLDTVIELLERKADVNVKSQYGHTALYHAISLGYQDFVDVLYSYGADVNAQTEDSSLVVASYRGSDVMVKQLLDRGADINVKGKSYGSALTTAVVRNKRSVVLLLLEHGAILDSDELSAIMKKAHLDTEHVESVKALSVKTSLDLEDFATKLCNIGEMIGPSPIEGMPMCLGTNRFACAGCGEKLDFGFKTANGNNEQ